MNKVIKIFLYCLLFLLINLINIGVINFLFWDLEPSVEEIFNIVGQIWNEFSEVPSKYQPLLAFIIFLNRVTQLLVLLLFATFLISGILYLLERRKVFLNFALISGVTSFINLISILILVLSINKIEEQLKESLGKYLAAVFFDYHLQEYQDLLIYLFTISCIVFAILSLANLGIYKLIKK